jgi:hypothetical protein
VLRHDFANLRFGKHVSLVPYRGPGANRGSQVRVEVLNSSFAGNFRFLVNQNISLLPKRKVEESHCSSSYSF